MKNILTTIAAAAMLAWSGTASAKSLADCGLNDIYFDVPGIKVTQCFGFTDGNVINSKPANMAAVSGILSTQFSFNGQSGAPIESINVSADHTTHITTYDFGHPLTGDVIIGLHFGNGGSTGNGTAFYEFNAGSGVEKFFTALQATSNAGLYKMTAYTPPVPEPETYAMLLAGLGLLGAIARRRAARG